MVHRIELPDGTVAGATRIEAQGYVVIAQRRQVDPAKPAAPAWRALSWTDTLSKARFYKIVAGINDWLDAEIVELVQCDGCEEMTPADTSSGELAGAVVCERCRNLAHAEMMRRDVAPIRERRDAAEADEVAREFEDDVAAELRRGRRKKRIERGET